MDWVDRMEARRKHLGLTQDELAEKLSVTVGAYQHWLSHRRTPDKLEMFEAIAKALKIAPSFLLYGVHDPENPKANQVLSMMVNMPEYKQEMLVAAAKSLVEPPSNEGKDPQKKAR